MRSEYASGLRLADASFHFASASLRQRYKRTPIEPGFDPKTLFPASATPAQIIKAICDLANTKIIPALFVDADVIEEMHERLLKGLKTGRFVALGFLKPRKPGDLLVEIPFDYLEADYLDWGRSAVRGPEMDFVDVKVARNQRNVSRKPAMPSLPRPQPTPVLAYSNSQPARSKGRPGKREQTRYACKVLLQSGRLTYGKLTKATEEAIQSFIS